MLRDQTIAECLCWYAWNNHKLEGLTRLVQDYCYRRLPVDLQMPQVDGVACRITTVSVSMSSERIFVLLKDSTILVLTEDFVIVKHIKNTSKTPNSTALCLPRLYFTRPDACFWSTLLRKRTA